MVTQVETSCCAKPRIRCAHRHAGDSVCRIGGEEFLVICPGTDLKAALRSAERLRASLEAKQILIGHTVKTITASIGVAVHEADTADIDALVSAADKALYQAKKDGRNQVCSSNA